MRILITGAAGFIGQHLVPELEQAGHKVTGIDRDDHDLRYELPDVSGYDYVVHLAAKVGRLFGEDDPLGTILDNIGITCLLARACGEAGVPLAYASTSEVYGDVGEALADEYYGPFNLPCNLYGLTKRQAEEVCKLYAPKGFLALRFSMPYGPGHPPGRGRAALTNMLHQALHNQPIPVHKGAERSWCWIGDTVRATRMILEAAHREPLQYVLAWNVGRDDNALPMYRVAQMACDLTGARRSLIQLRPAPERQIVVKRLSTGRVRRLGWKPEVELAEGMARVLDYVKGFDKDGNPCQPSTAPAA